MKNALAKIANQLDLTHDEMQNVVRQIMTGNCTEAQIAAFLMALRIKSETIEEITAIVQIMRELANTVNIQDDNAVDIVGTGGDGIGSFNISTAASFIVSACNITVAKHGNRAVSGKTGSADVLEELGVNIHLDATQVTKCIDTLGIGFMFAQNHHGAMKHVAKVRSEIGIRSVFNLVGPLINPAKVSNQVIGVFSKTLCLPVAEVLKRLGSKHVLVLHSYDGLDEISLSTKTHITELNNGTITSYDIQPEDFGIESGSMLGMTVNNAKESAELITNIFNKRDSDITIKASNLVLLNAAAAIYVSGKVSSFKDATLLAQDALYSGLAYNKLQDLINFTRVFKNQV